MATFVIVHGGWGGGWEWTPVARLLRARGHDVFTPTLTGMGERSHLGRKEVVDLSTHIEDVVAVLEFEDLHGVVLCAASYGGLPVTGAADRCADRVALLVYVDALVPAAGQAGIDLAPGPLRDMALEGLAENGPNWRMPMPEELLEALYPPGSIPDEVRAGLQRIRPQPAATFTEPLHLSGAVDSLQRAFIRCLNDDWTESVGGDLVVAGAERAKAEGWLYREVKTGHDPHILAPEETAALLEELAATAGA
jgi:pimeloyl-ACP methyl ester carboxylesterase